MDTHALPPEGLISRPRLLQQLDAGLRRGSRLFLIVAPAGYGKTTLLRAWLAGRQAAPLWHTLDEADNDPAHLLTAVQANLRAALPGAVFPPLDAQSPLTYTLDLLFRHATPARQDWLLLLDDYHLITNPNIHQALDTLLGRPTWPVRLVLATRSLPPLAAIARLRVEGRLTEIDETDLRFALSETQSLLADSGLPLDEAALRQILARTEGWPVALSLLRQAAQRQATPDLAALLRRMGDERPLFDYLAGQVLARQPAALQTFLRRTALLPYLSADLCNAFLGSTDASAILDELERGHLFIAPLADRPGRCYRYYSLFQEFLSRCLEHEEGAAAVLDWHRRAADALLTNLTGTPPPQQVDDRAAAIAHLLAAQEWTAAAQQIETLVTTLEFGELPRLEPWFERLPAEVVAGRPRLLLAWGRLRERQGRFPEADDLLAQAERACRPGQSQERAAVLRWQAWVRFRQDRYAEAIALCHRALGDLPGSPPDPAASELDTAAIPADPALLVELAGIYNILANCYGNQGDWEKAQPYYLASLQLYRRLGNREREALALHNLAAGLYLPQGRLRETIEAEQTSLRALDELHSYRVCFPLITLGMAYLKCGDLEAARAVLERLLHLADAYQDAHRRAYALLLLGHLHRERGDRAAAHRCYEEAHIIAHQVQDRFILFELQQGWARLALDEDDLREARRQSLAARERVQQPPDQQLEGQALTTLGLVLEKSGDARLAEDTYHQALLLVESAGGCLDQAAIRLYLADLCRREGRDDEARVHLGQALALSGEYGYDFLFAKQERRRALPLLVAALGQPGELPEEAGRLLTLIGPEAVEPLLNLLAQAPVEVQERVVRLLGEIGDERAVPALSALRRQRRLQEPVHEALERIAAAPCPPLRVRALGGFQVSRGEVPIPAEAWQRRKKTRLLLLYLLGQRGPVPADEVLEALWPDLSPEAAGQALNTTFSELRRILEPHLPRGMASRYLERAEETLSFRRESALWYDVEAFEQAVRKGGQTTRQSLELYRGDFLPEEPYVDWVLRERERLRGLYLNVLTEQLEEHVAAGDWREGVELARRILEREPWLEEVWRALLTCYDRLGWRGEALRAYQECVQALREELDVAPSPETQALYERIKGDAPSEGGSLADP